MVYAIGPVKTPLTLVVCRCSKITILRRYLPPVGGIRFRPPYLRPAAAQLTQESDTFYKVGVMVDAPFKADTLERSQHPARGLLMRNVRETRLSKTSHLIASTGLP